MNRTQRVRILLDAILAGLVVEIGDRRYALSENKRLCVIAKNETTGEYMLLTTWDEYALERFLELVDSLSENETVVVAANVTIVVEEATGAIAAA